MISDLRKRLDDVTFRRNNKGESWDFSANRLLYQQYTTVEKYDNAPLMHSQEDETILHETEFHRNEHKNKKPQYNGQLPTVFAERLHKRIIKDEKEDVKMQRTSWKLDIEANSKGISEENIVESDKENGSQSSMNNNDNESNAITRHSLSDSENPCKKNSGKRLNEEDNTYGNKRLKIDDNEGKTTTDETDYTVRYKLKDNLVQYEMKDNPPKFEDRLNATHSLKEEKISFDEGRAVLEYQDTAKQSRDCINGWKGEEKSNFRIASNCILDEPSNGYKSGYRYNLSRRSNYSRNRSDYDSSSSHRLREKSNRMYRNNRKYNDYKYNNQYRTKKDYRLKRDYESMENDSKTIHRSREHNATWDKSRHLSSDVEDKEGNSSYKNKRYQNRRIEETATNILHNKSLHERDKAKVDMNSRASSGRTIVNNIVNHKAKKITQQDKAKNESNIKPINSIESTSTYVVTKDSSNLEEGEIVDSPKKKIDSAKISKDHKVIENDVKIVLIDDKHKDVPVIASIIDDKSVSFHDNVITAKQLDNVTDISTKEIETASCPVQTALKGPKEIAELNFSGKNDAIIDEVWNCNNVEHIYKSQRNEDLTVLTTCTIETIEQVCESQYNEDLMDLTTYTIGTINQVCDSNVDDDGKSRAEEESKIFVTEIPIKMEKMIDSNTKSVTEVRIDDPKVESAINKDKVSDCNTESPIIIIETNNSDNIIREIDDELKSSTTEIAEKIEIVFNCDIENGDVSQVSIGSETSRWTSGKSNVEMSTNLCLNDHNYVQNPPVNASDLNAVRESPVNSEYCKTVPEAAMLKETKAKENMDVSVDVKKTMSPIVKNKKNQQSKGIVISRRRRAVTLSDSNASMTVLINTKTSSNVISNCSNESVLKPRACKALRTCK
ncbi:general transcriptional corepressor trfA isoform X2 [Polyergus mexicanus]